MPPDKPENNGATCEYLLVPEQVLTDLDPELQNAVLGARLKPPVDAKADALEGDDAYVDVLARLNSSTDVVPEEIDVSQQVGGVITGRVQVKNIERVRKHKSILSLKGGRKVYETLDSSVSEIGASRPQLRANFPGRVFDGSNVIVGVIDHGCDFAHPNFRNARGTRILYLWDQNKTSEAHPPPRGYQDGRELTAEAINSALEFGAPQCYERLDYQPASFHGTQVLDIAAGNGTDTNPPGVAPNADLIFVDVMDDDTSIEEPLGNSRNLFEAVKYIFDKADEIGKQEESSRAVVINISLNSTGGPHDGSTPFERGIDQLLQTPGRAVVIAAGNSAGRRSGNKGHVGGILQPGQKLPLSWQISSDDKTDNKVEIWYGGAYEIELSLVSPGNQVLSFFELGTTTTIYCSGKQVARVFHRRKDPNNHDNQILIVFCTAMESGTWRIVLRSLSKSPFGFHAWKDSDRETKSGFLDLSGSDDTCTIGSLACGYSTIAVGGYFTESPHAILPKSSEGPTRDGRLKPEVSAPGASGPPSLTRGGGIRAAMILTRTTSTSTGTSAAAPHVTGLVALLMQGSLPALLPVERIRELVIKEARRNPPSGDCSWHPRFGAGRVNALSSLLCQAGVTSNFDPAPSTAGARSAPHEVAATDVHEANVSLESGLEEKVS